MQLDNYAYKTMDFSIDDPTAYVIYSMFNAIFSVLCNVELRQEANCGTSYLEKYIPHLFHFLEIGYLNYEL